MLIACREKISPCVYGTVPQHLTIIEIPLFMNSPAAWINGTLKPCSETNVPVWDLGVVAGAAVTEMARTYAHQPFRLHRHVHRLCSSLRDLDFPFQGTEAELLQAAQEVTAQNSRLIPTGSDLGIVMFSTAGSNATYLGGASDRTTTVVHTFELPFALWRANVLSGVRLRVPEIRQLPEQSFPVRHKVRNRLHWWMADRAVNRTDPGSRALLLDESDNVTETSTSCFYAVVDGMVVTSATGVLRSLTSELVEEFCQRLSIPFHRGRLSGNDLTTISSAFLSSTPTGLIHVSHINGRELSAPSNDDPFTKLRACWNEYVGLDVQQQILTMGAPSSQVL